MQIIKGSGWKSCFDEDYITLCPWADLPECKNIWPVELTDAVVEIFESEKDNREQRRKKREERNQKGKGE